ncbi:MAG: GGDEF domain-containing protein [Porticoccaceae bacterium]|nr:GGDEF domain-containing protein [Porticoccaceae bacterium]
MLFALLLCWQQQALGSDLIALLPQLPSVLLLIAALLALLSNRSRERALSLSVLSTYWLIRQHLQAPLESQPASQIFLLIAFAIPILTILLVFIPEQGLTHAQGVTTYVGMPLTMLALSQLVIINPELFAESSQALVSDPLWFTRLSAGTGLIYAIAVGIALTMIIRRQQSIESSVLGCIAMLFITLGWIQLSNISAAMFTGLGLLLTINITSGLLHIGFYDELTQIGNRRALIEAAKTAGNQYTLAMVDADHFKKINDRFGHDLGDQALKVIASCMLKTGCGGKAYRYGGEEFCLLFKGKSREQVADCLEQLRQAIANYDMVIRDKKQRPRERTIGEKKRGASKRHSNLRLTISVGVADSSSGGNFEHLMKLADRALYRAKAGGRNRLEFA